MAAEPISKVETVTPELASEWMGLNELNRKMRRSVVNRYRKDIVEGRWDLNDAAISFSTDGLLLNGQHRLQAIIEARVPVKTFVTRGLAPESQQSMDSGSARTAADVIGLAGGVGTSKSHKTSASIANIMLAYENSYPLDGRSLITKSQVVEYAMKNPMVDEATKFAVPAALKVDTTPKTLGAAWIILKRIDPAEAEKFLQGFVSGVGLPEGSPIIALRDKLRSLDKPQQNNARICLNLIFKAWNAWRKGKTVQSFHLPNTSITPR